MDFPTDVYGPASTGSDGEEAALMRLELPHCCREGWTLDHILDGREGRRDLCFWPGILLAEDYVGIRFTYIWRENGG